MSDGINWRINPIAFWVVGGGLAFLVLAALGVLELRTQCLPLEGLVNPIPNRITVQSEQGETYSTTTEKPPVTKFSFGDSLDALLRAPDRIEGAYYTTPEPYNWRRQFLCSVNAADYTLALLTFILALFTLGLIFVGFRQASWMKRTIDDANRQHATSERAFAYLKKCSVTVDEQTTGDLRVQITPVWFNSGHTPTKNAQILTAWKSHKNGLPRDFNYPHESVPEIAFIGPGAEVGSTTIEIPNAIVDKLLEMTTRVFVYGVIHYRDIFENTKAHHTAFCFELTLARMVKGISGKLSVSGAYNCTDDDDRSIRQPETVWDGFKAYLHDIQKI